MHQIIGLDFNHLIFSLQPVMSNDSSKECDSEQDVLKNVKVKYNEYITLHVFLCNFKNHICWRI